MAALPRGAEEDVFWDVSGRPLTANDICPNAPRFSPAIPLREAEDVFWACAAPFSPAARGDVRVAEQMGASLPYEGFCAAVARAAARVGRAEAPAFLSERLRLFVAQCMDRCR